MDHADLRSFNCAAASTRTNTRKQSAGAKFSRGPASKRYGQQRNVARYQKAKNANCLGWTLGWSVGHEGTSHRAEFHSSIWVSGTCPAMRLAWNKNK